MEEAGNIHSTLPAKFPTYPAMLKGKGYPCRAIRTRDHLYIHNFEPTRWPSGSPDASDCARAIPFGEIDSSPTKEFIMANRDQHGTTRLAALSFDLRPKEELYELKSDPGQLNNLADSPNHAETLKGLRRKLFARLEATGDPRVIGGPVMWDHYPYYGKTTTKGWSVDPPPER